ncbi:hypothetical protein BV25DRAFT_1829878 [Artomyces pyxidatus]|uniref:Uncharacterized protein n=1 Tax=Artomyces pyxidatus TaxID=48021 RepID=A0ACB8SS20_9AGAM|nr:hypothetical protein BV25DRAFT_1829878 [Artomyces pyxidatus]
MVTESLLHAYYVPVASDLASGFCVILPTRVTSPSPSLERPLPFIPRDVFAVIPLHHSPIVKEEPSSNAQSIWLLDPLDMLPVVYELRHGYAADRDSASLQDAILSNLVPPPWKLGTDIHLAKNMDPLYWWNKFAEDLLLGEDLRADLTEELLSSYEWQKAAYESPPPCPTLASSPSEWEQCLLEGHPTHPMHRARRTLPPLPAVSPDTRSWYHPKIRFALVPRGRLDIKGTFEAEIRPLAQMAARRCGRPIPDGIDDQVLMPVYDLQTANIRAKFPDCEILDEDFSLDALGQASIRTVVVPDMPHIVVKLAVGIKVSSALRTISHFTANLGPRFSAQIIPKLAIDTRILYVEREVGSAVYARDATGADVDPEVAKHFTAVLRVPYMPEEDEAVVVCAALLEWGHRDVPLGVPVIQHVLGDTEDKKIVFFDEYTRLLLAAVIPPMVYNGIGFEAHPQNTLLRLSRTSRKLRGFVLRDLGGLRVHPPTLRASTGVPFEFLPGHCVVTASLEEAAKKLYHTLIHNHLQRLARVLGLHYNGTAWEIVRRHMVEQVPRDSWLWPVWMGEGSTSVAGKCLVRMKLQGVYRDSVYEPFPNLIQYRPA